MLPKVITASYLLVAIHGSLFSFFFLKNLFPIRVWFSLVPNERRLIEIHSSGNMYTSSQLAIANRMKNTVGCTAMNDHVHDRQLSGIITCLLTYLYKLVEKKNKIFSD